MTNAAITGLLLAGFLAGNVAFASVTRWVYALWEILRAPQAPTERSAVAARLAAATLLNSGPWMLAILAGITYFAYAEPWAKWLFAGFAGAITFLGLIAASYTIRKRRARPPESAGVDLPSRLQRRMSDRKATLGGAVFSYAIGLVGSLAVPFTLDRDYSPIVWGFFIVFGLMLGYIGQRMQTESLQTKPWVERRKPPSPE